MIKQNLGLHGHFPQDIFKLVITTMILLLLLLLLL